GGRPRIRGGRRSPRRTSRTCRSSRRVSTRRASSTCACPAGSKDTSRTSSGSSTASSPAFHTSNSSRRCSSSTPRRSTSRSPTSASDQTVEVSAPTTYVDIFAGVAATIAAYTHALDDGRTDDVVATFCTDGGCDIPGLGTVDGHEALREAYAGWKPPQPMRHVVVNTLVTEWDDHEAKASSDV